MILFTTDRPDLYLLSEIFDSHTNPTGTIIPRPNSLVIDPVNNGLLRRVLSVDETTNNSTLGPVFTALLSPPTPDLDPTGSSILSIIDYGNSRFYLFYDQAETPTKLNVDKKVIILGDDAVSFEISRFDAALQRYIPISLYYDTDGTYRGTRVPLVVIGTASNAKIPTNCHTTMPLVEDEIYHMFIYDYAGTQCGSVKLFAKNAIINNTPDDNLIIENFIVEATQMDNGEFYLFPDQDPLGLVVSPRVVYNDGTTKLIPIDNNVCHLYGLEGFSAAYPGQTVDLLIKYFLLPTQQAVGPTLVASGSTRYLMRQIRLTVKDPGTNEYSVKLLTVPVYLPTINKWALRFFLYTINDNVVRDVTTHVTVAPAFDGRSMGTEQELSLTIKIRDIFPNAASDFYYTQPLIIKLAPYSFYERYVLRDTIGDTYGVYGTDSTILPRPVLHFDDVAGKHFVPTSKFINKTMMLEAFYYKIRPLYDSGWLSSPATPSHFTIRNSVNGVLLLSAPIPISGYQQGFSLINVDTQNQLVGGNCIVEFLLFEHNQYTVLFGAPVDVYPGTYV